MSYINRKYLIAQFDNFSKRISAVFAKKSDIPKISINGETKTKEVKITIGKAGVSNSYNDLDNKPVIDASLNTNSTNAVQNKAVTAKINTKADNSTVSDLESQTVLNILPYPYADVFKGKEVKGIKSTTNKDGSFSLKGTVTGGNLYVGLHYENTSNSWFFKDRPWKDGDTIYSYLKVNGTLKGELRYLLQYKGQNTGSTVLSDIFYYTYKNLDLQNAIKEFSEKKVYKESLKGTEYYNCIYIYLGEGTTVDATFYPCVAINHPINKYVQYANGNCLNEIAHKIQVDNALDSTSDYAISNSVVTKELSLKSTKKELDSAKLELNNSIEKEAQKTVVNLVPFPYQMKNSQHGLTVTNNIDGSLTIKGTTDAQCWIGVHNNNYDNPWLLKDVPWKDGDTLYIYLKEKGTIEGITGVVVGYKVSTSPSSIGTSLSTGGVKTSIKDGEKILTKSLVCKNVPFDKATHVVFYIYFGADTTVDATFYPMLTMNEQSTDYVRYAGNGTVLNEVVGDIAQTIDNDNITYHSYAICSTPRNDSNKVVDCPNFVLKTGSSVFVRFTATDTVDGTDGITLNVNGTGAYPVRVSKTHHLNQLTGGGNWLFHDNRTWQFVYDGEMWNLLGYDTEPTFTNFTTTVNLSGKSGSYSGIKAGSNLQKSFIQCMNNDADLNSKKQPRTLSNPVTLDGKTYTTVEDSIQALTVAIQALNVQSGKIYWNIKN